MAENTKTSQLDSLPGGALTALFRMAFAGKDYSLSITDLIALINIDAISTPVTISPSTDEDIILGAASQFDKFTIDYTSIRGSRVRGGILIIVNDGITAKVSEPGYGTIPISDMDCGISGFDASITSGQVVLNVACDDSDANETSFKYKILSAL